MSNIAKGTHKEYINHTIIVTHSDGTDPDIIPSIQLYRNTSSFPFEQKEHIQYFYSQHLLSSSYQPMITLQLPFTFMQFPLQYLCIHFLLYEHFLGSDTFINTHLQ